MILRFDRGWFSRKRVAVISTAWVFLVQGLAAPSAQAYSLNRTIAAAGGCPNLDHFDTGTAGKLINRRWSTSLDPSTVTIFTVDQTSTGRLNEIEQTILESFSVWTSVTGTTLTPSSLATLQRTATQSACISTDGLNSICFNEAPGAFSTGVLAFTRVVTSDIKGERLGASGPSAFIGEILDADIEVRPDGSFTFATPGALGSNSTSFDLESILIHELGHFFGFGHSGVWRAMVYPFAPPRGQFVGDRPTLQVPDGPLSDDDRVGLRVLYPDPSDTVNVGSISGFIRPANLLSLATLPSPSPGRSVTGIFGTHVVAVDADTGAVVAATLGGWSCDAANLPTNFDGSYIIERLPVGRRYKIYVEPFDGPVSSGNIIGATSDLCRPDVPQPCTVPAVNTNFTTQVRP